MKKKEQGQYMTPNKIVEIILKNIEYKDVLNKTIMEPSFGEGVFLLNILEKIIEKSREKNLSNETIIKIIKNNIYGIRRIAR